MHAQNKMDCHVWAHWTRWGKKEAHGSDVHEWDPGAKWNGEKTLDFVIQSLIFPPSNSFFWPAGLTFSNFPFLFSLSSSYSNPSNLVFACCFSSSCPYLPLWTSMLFLPLSLPQLPTLHPFLTPSFICDSSVFPCFTSSPPPPPPPLSLPLFLSSGCVREAVGFDAFINS